MIVIVMGVSGAGKTTVGAALARELGCPFIDADDYHLPQNVAKMAAGTPLDDEDRRPWLQKLNSLLLEEEDAVLACSALKQSYREQLTRGLRDCRIVHLRGSFELIASRLEDRKHRYMPASLLESQFAALEEPGEAIAVDVAGEVQTIVAAIAARLR